jgi:hypothetical protein
MKTLLKKIVNDEDLKATGFNITAAWVFGKTASMISSAVFNFNLNQYNSIDHLMMGVGIGTLTYRKAGRGIKGIAAGLTAATMLNVAWEGFEGGFNPYHHPEILADRISDIAVVYAGSTLSFLGEKFKNYLNKDK